MQNPSEQSGIIGENKNIRKTSTEFKSILNNIKKNIEENKGELFFDLCEKYNLSDKAIKALGDLETILDIKITEKDFTEDGHVDIRNILEKGSASINSSNVEKIKKCVYTLYKEEAITLKQYLEALQLIRLKQKSQNIKVECENNFIKSINNAKEILNNRK